MKLMKSACVIAMLVSASVSLAEDVKPETILLWSGKAPIGDGKFADEDATIFVYRPAQPNGTSIVICPGGGYGGLAIQPEGHGIAKWLNENGITGIVLQYRLPKGRSSVPMSDAQRAIQLTRLNASKWNLDASKVGIMGFSAGGHLAATCTTHFAAGDADAKDPHARITTRPDFAILIYPVITMDESTHSGSKRNLLGDNPGPEQLKYFSNELQVTEKTPATFLAHAIDDKPVPSRNSEMFYKALQAKKVPARYLELPDGGHGLNGYKGASWDAWQKQSLEWLRELKLSR